MIYLIDDDNSIRRSFDILFRSADLEFQAFHDTAEFLDRYLPNDNNILILDMQMPGMSGCEVMKKLSESGITIPVIVVTAFDDPQSRQCAKKYGVVAYLRKPVDGNALIDLINFKLEKEKS